MYNEVKELVCIFGGWSSASVYSCPHTLECHILLNQSVSGGSAVNIFDSYASGAFSGFQNQ
jgi:hypothetical protein